MEKTTVKECRLVVIGGSAGSLDVVLKILQGLEGGLPFAIVIVLHRKGSSDSTLVDLLNAKTSIPTREVEDKEIIAPNTIYVAPANYHLLVENENEFSLDFSEKINFSRPSIDVTFESAAEVYGPSLVCILLSGANMDGVAGLNAAKENGATLVAQKPETALVPFMPQQAILHSPVDFVFDAEEITAYVNLLTRGK